jgi:pyruvate kinase
VHFSPGNKHHLAVNKGAIDVLQASGEINDGDIVIITKGDKNSTDMLKLVTVGDMIEPRLS